MGAKIGIVDAEIIGKSKHRFPNLACMKISAYHKSVGDDVDLLLDYDSICLYDKVYISKVFTETPVPDHVLTQPNVEYGGTGFFYDKAPPLPCEIEHIKPDYHLYDKWVEMCTKNWVSRQSLQYYTDFSLGFATRGCFRQCSFCVNKNCTKSTRQGSILEWVDMDRPYICCLDDNVFACPDWREVFKELQATGKRFQFKQGCDERLLTDEKCDVLFNKSKWLGDYIFAFDSYKDKDIVVEKLNLIKKHTNKRCKFYCFCGYNHDEDIYDDQFWIKDLYELFLRIEILMQYGCLPYIMRHENYNNSPFRGMYITIARWCNQPNFFKKQSLREYCTLTNGVNSAAYRYLTEFENLHPHFKPFFDMKFENVRKITGGSLNE